MKKALFTIVLFSLFFLLSTSVRAVVSSCGSIMFPGDTCSCASGPNSVQGGTCCGWVYDGQCQSKEVFSCGSGYLGTRTDATCAPSCPVNGTYTPTGTNQVYGCCGWVYGGQCSAVQKQVVSCGGSYSSSESATKICSASCGSEGDYTNSTGFVLHCCGYAYNGTCHTTPQPQQTIACGGSYDRADTAKVCNTSCGHEEDFTDTNGNFMHCCGWSFDGVCGTKQTLACGQSYLNDVTNVQCSPSCAGTQYSDATDGNKGKVCCGFVTNSVCYATPTAINVTCGKTYPTADASKYACACNGVVPYGMPNGQTCCGYRPTGGGTNGCFSTIQPLPGDTTGADPGLTAGTLANLNSAIFGGAPDAQLTTPRGIISKLLPYLFTFGGLILFVMLIWGGFEMLTGAANPKSQEAGKQRITAAIIGFILLFSSYWLAQLVQTIFGLTIL